MSNPWEEINLNDYENHMSLGNVYQLQMMNKMMKEQFYSYNVKSVMVLGIAGGNGLEHIDTNKIDCVYGVDINQNYLNECKQRYSELGDTLKTICADLRDENLQLPCSELLIANLLIEYIGYECFQKVIKIVNSDFISCIIQLNTENSFVSDSPYLHLFDGLDEVHHQIEEKALISCMQKIGYALNLTKDESLPNGKKLVRFDFVR